MLYSVFGFNYKMQNVFVGLSIRIPLIGPLIGRLVKPIREMYDGMTVRDNYVDRLVTAKRAELDSDMEVTKG